VDRSFEELIDEAERAPVTGWDFSFLDGRATEDRPSWRYFDRVAERAGRVSSLLDLQAGTGHMVAALPQLPPLVVATEAYRPSVAFAARRIEPRGAHLIVTHDAALPIRDGMFELVTSRHPVETYWREIAKVLRPGGTYFSQQVGPRSLRDLSEFLMGPLPAGSQRDPELAAEAAASAGLVVTDLRQERPLTAFLDIGAVVYFFRLVVWTVPDFAVDRYLDRLRALHEQIERDGAFVTTSSRFLIEAVRPG
jgi:SAM-dependent methyltransferase